MRYAAAIALFLPFIVDCSSCNKTAEISQPDASAFSTTDAATTTNTADDAGSTKGKPKNLSVEHGTTGLRTKLNACYATALAKNPDERGSTELTISIAADGHVKEAKVTGSTLSNETLDCIRQTTETYGFDPLDRDTAIMIPLYYSPKPEAGAGDLDGGVRRPRYPRDAGAAH